MKRLLSSNSASNGSVTRKFGTLRLPYWPYALTTASHHSARRPSIYHPSHYAPTHTKSTRTDTRIKQSIPHTKLMHPHLASISSSNASGLHINYHYVAHRHQSNSSTPSSSSSSSSSTTSTTSPSSATIDESTHNHQPDDTHHQQLDEKVFSISQDDDKIDRRTYPIAFSSLLMGTGIGVILPVMPLFANEIGINTMQYGMVISVMGITRLLMNIPAGFMADKFGRKPTLVGGPLLSACGTLIIAAAHSLNDLIISRFVTGAGGSIQMAGAQAYLSDISTVRNRARTIAPLMIGFSAGAALGPFIGGFLCDYYESVRIPFVFVAGAISAVALNNYIMLPETLSKEQRKQKSGDIKQTLSKMMDEWKHLWTNVPHLCGVSVHTAFWFTQAGATFTLMPLFATNELGVSATQIGGIFAMMSVVNIFGAQLFAKISDKFGRKKVIVPAVCIIAACVPLIPHVSDITHLYYLMFVYSIGSTMLGASPTAYIADIHSGSKEKEERRSQALAMLRSGGDCGLMIGSGLLGYLAHATGSFVMPMCTASVVLAMSGINFAINARETVHRSRVDHNDHAK